jgi:hypothetical protein
MLEKKIRQRIASKKYYYNNRNKIINNQIKITNKKRKDFTIITKSIKSNGCAICGYNKCIGALDFHHVNPEDKKFKIDKACVGRADKTVFNEIQKCIVLCSNCHREIHYNEN